MKKICSKIVLITFTLFSFITSAQILEKESGEFLIKEDFLIELSCCENRRRKSPLDLSFEISYGSALSNHDLIQQAKEHSLNAWFNRQENLMRQEIENRFGRPYPNFEYARNDYFKHWERQNILRQAPRVRNKYSSRITTRRGIEEKYARNLKLLELRELELNLGNVNNTSYRAFNFNDVPVGNITSLSQLNSLRVQEMNALKQNQISLHNDIGVRDYVSQVIIGDMGSSSNQFNFNHDILNEVLLLQINHYNNIGNRPDLTWHSSWYQLELMQLYLNNIRPDFFDTNFNVSTSDFGTSTFIETHSVQNRRNGVAIFNYSSYENYLMQQMLHPNENDERAIDAAEHSAELQAEAERERYLNNLLNDVNLADLKIQNIIETLEYTNHSDQAHWLNNHPQSSDKIFNLINSSSSTPSQIQHIKDIIEVLRNTSLSDEQKFEKFKIADKIFDPYLSQNEPKEKYEAKIRHYAKKFKQWGNKEFGNYLESLLPLDSSYSQEDYNALYNIIRNKKTQLFWDYIRAIVGTTVESFKPVIEMALWEVGGGLALKVLSKLPVRYLTTPVKNVIKRLKTPTSTAFSKLKHAKKYGIKSYKELEETFKNLGLSLSKKGVERHHLIEKRFFKNPNLRSQLQQKFGKTTDDWLCIIVEKTNKLTQSEHYKFTQAWRKAIGVKTKGTTGYHQGNVPFDEVIKVAKKIYKDYPEILKALGL